MRISEEQDRRRREEAALARLPRALEELNLALADCIQGYQRAFGANAADSTLLASKVRVIAREQVDGQWRQSARVEVTAVPAIPGFQIDYGTGGEPVIIEVGLLPGDKVYYRDLAKDQYVNLEDLTRRVLDRAFFPKLSE